MNKKLLLIFFLIFIAYIFAGYFWNLHQRPTGDEPHYLIISQSIIKDRDLDLKNNYNERDYARWHYPTEILDRHISPNSRAPHEYSLHNVGWPIILVPIVALNHLIALKFFTAILATLLLANIYLLLKKFVKEKTAIIVTILIGFSAPILIFSTQVFNELFAALLIVYASRKLFEPTKSIWQELFALICIAYLPWVHVKYLLISLVLFILFILKNRQKIKSWQSFLFLIYALSILKMGYLFYLWYGSPLPSAQYPNQMNFHLASLGQGIVSLIFDRSFGLVPIAPIYLLAIPGFYLLYKNNKKAFWQILAIFLSLFLVQAAGAAYIGWAPQGRFLVPILPLLSIPVVLVINKSHSLIQKIIIYFLSLWGLLIGLYLIIYPSINYNISDSSLFSSLKNHGLNIGLIFPRLLNSQTGYLKIDQQSWLVLFFWLITIVFLCWLFLKPQSPQTITKKAKRDHS